MNSMSLCHAFRLIVFAITLVVIALSTHAQSAQSVIPPETRRPNYQVVDRTYFESKFGPSFTGNDVTPLVVGAKLPSGGYLLQRIDTSSGSPVLQDAGTVLPGSFKALPHLTASAKNMVDFVNPNPELVAVDYSVSTSAQAITATVTTAGGEKLRMQGTWLVLTVSRRDIQCNSTTTVFIAEVVQDEPGNESLLYPSEDLDIYLHRVDCEALLLDPLDCAEMQACWTAHATCMVNAATTYNNAIAECNSWSTLIVGVGVGACGGLGAGCAIGTIFPGIGNCIGGALGIITGGFSGGLGAHWLCVRNARLAYENSVDVCYNGLEGCLEQWVMTP